MPRGSKKARHNGRSGRNEWKAWGKGGSRDHKPPSVGATIKGRQGLTADGGRVASTANRKLSYPIRLRLRNGTPHAQTHFITPRASRTCRGVPPDSGVRPIGFRHDP